MSRTAATPEALVLHEFVAARCDELRALLTKYGATNSKLFGPVAP